MTRALTQTEYGLVETLLDHYGANSSYLHKQLQQVAVTPINDDGSIIRFELPSTAIAAPMPRIHFVPVEATAKDADGTPIHVLLHVRNGMIYELEYVKEAPLPILRIPEARDLRDFIIVP